MTAIVTAKSQLPAWLPDAVRIYLSHTEDGISLRALARREGCHASTVLRQVRRFENRRDDPLVDEALARLGHDRQLSFPNDSKDPTAMTAQFRTDHLLADEQTIAREARRILRRLCEAGSVLAIAADMDKAIELGMLRAEKHGFSTEKEVFNLIAAMVVFGPDFADGPQKRYFHRSLDSKSPRLGSFRADDLIEEVQYRLDSHPEFKVVALNFQTYIDASRQGNDREPL